VVTLEKRQADLVEARRRVTLYYVPCSKCGQMPRGRFMVDMQLNTAEMQLRQDEGREAFAQFGQAFQETED